MPRHAPLSVRDSHTRYETLANLSTFWYQELLSKTEDHLHFRKVLGAITEFGADVSTALTAVMLATQYKCPSCKAVFALQSSTTVEFRCPFNCHAKNGEWWASYVV